MEQVKVIHLTGERYRREVFDKEQLKLAKQEWVARRNNK